MWTRRPAVPATPAARATAPLSVSWRYSVILLLMSACGGVAERSAPDEAPAYEQPAAQTPSDAPMGEAIAETAPETQAMAKREEGRAQGAKVKASTTRPMERATAAPDRRVEAIVAGDAAAYETLPQDLSQGIGGLIGARGTQTGAGGLGARGTGLGGGGTASSVGYAPPPPVVTNTESYKDYGTNEMTLATADHLSTFSIDVDTASYTIARRKLLEGGLPPAAAVRVEEFVNYFPYRYAQPQGDAPFSVNLEAAPNPWEPNHHLVRVGVQGREIAEGKEKPRRLTFLVDTSGSMQSEDKIGLVKQSLRYLVGQLGPEDSVAIVTYAGWTEVVLPATPVTHKGEIIDAIERLSANGSTAMGSGLELAYKQASRAYVKGAENRVLVLSDGDANVGPTSHEAILETIQQYAGKGITLSTLGFGSGNYKDTIMEQLADQGDGNYFYVDSFAEGRRVFGEKLTGTMDTIARDVKIQVDWNSEAVLSYRLVGYENRDIADRDFRNDKVDAGEIGSGHSVTALYDVILRDGALDSNKSLAKVQIRAKQPGPDRPAREWATSLTASAFNPELASTSADFRIATAAASFAEIMRGSRYTNEITYAAVYKLAAGAKRKGVEEDAELLDLIARAGELSGQRGPWGASVADR